jgi:hypothetical protein
MYVSRIYSLLKKVLFHVGNTTRILQVSSDHETPPGTGQRGATAILTQFGLFHEIKEPALRSTVRVQLVHGLATIGPRGGGNGFQFSREARGRIEGQQVPIERLATIFPSRLCLDNVGRRYFHGQIATNACRGLLDLAHGAFELKPGIAQLVRRVGGHTQFQNAHGIDKVAFDAIGLALSAACPATGKQLSNVAPQDRIGDIVLKLENVIIRTGLESDSVCIVLLCVLYCYLLVVWCETS